MNTDFVRYQNVYVLEMNVNYPTGFQWNLCIKYLKNLSVYNTGVRLFIA